MSELEQLELVFYRTQGLSNKSIMSLTGRSSNIVCDWMILCQDIPVKMFEKRIQIGGPDVIIQVYECLLRGSRKNHIDFSSENIEDENDDPLENGKRNYGRRMEGPWVFGLCNGSEAQYFVVEKRDKQTLQEIIKREVILGSIIHSNGWPVYNGIAQHGYTHNTVNHCKNFVDSLTQAHTQQIEHLWRPLHLKVVKNMCGTSPDLPR
ncbi:hypothetical protein AGLY_010744 [Aphis glycines]|uniref:ISXO2-like transposase domain-containing protein n=1 Tax=Aphis glycines TaxID=307491 RepID=A0A6G0TEU6_APHGL|nr:hypothetical protein AGLY_010744 [Aphis glycines]